MTFPKLTLLAATLALTVTGFSAMAQNVAVVNGKPVPKARAQALLNQLARQGRPITPEVEAQVRDEVIIREIFVQEAERQGLASRPDYRQQMEMARQSILIRELFNEFQQKNKVSDAEIKAEYDKLKSQMGDKEYHSRHILVEKEDQAKALIAQLKSGAKFDDLAKKNSKDPGSAPNGGDLDWAGPSAFVKEFSDAMMALQKGQVTETPVKSQFGFHIIKLDDVREAQIPSFEEVKGQMQQQLTQQKVEKFQNDLRAKARVQ